PAGAQILETGPHGQDGGEPEHDIAGEAQAGNDALEQDDGEGNKLDRGLPLGQPADRQYDLDVAQEFPQAGNEEFAEQDGAGRDHVEGGEAAIPGQRGDQNPHQQL